MKTNPDEPALRLRHVGKTFPGQRALADFGIDVAAGEIHGLIGQNGSGKSTLVKLLAGYHQPDPGSEAMVAGEPFPLGSPSAAYAAGLRFVHQDLGLVADLDVAGNLALTGTRRRALQLIGRSDEQVRAAAATAALGYDIDPRARVSGLSASERTIVAVARALDSSGPAARLLVVDEATATLPQSEAVRLLAALRRIAETGVAVILVSHHLEEVVETTNRVTALRDGRQVTTFQTSEVDQVMLAEAMLGRKLMLDSRSVPISGSLSGPPACEIKALSGATVRDLSLELHRGEVLGIAGVTGSGREAVAGLVSGHLPRQGSVAVAGKAVAPASPVAALDAGIVCVPANRAREALLTTGSVRENMTIADLKPVSRLARISGRAERQDVHRWIEELSVDPPRTEVPVTALSGGNQQKVVMARWLRVKPSVLVLDEPTQGVDVGAQVDIHRLVDRAAAGGTAVLIASTDSNELARLCNRVLIMSRGVIVDEISGADVEAALIEQAQLNPLGGSR